MSLSDPIKAQASPLAGCAESQKYLGLHDGLGMGTRRGRGTQRQLPGPLSEQILVSPSVTGHIGVDRFGERQDKFSFDPSEQ